MNTTFNPLKVSALVASRHYFMEAIKCGYPSDLIAILHADMREEERKAKRKAAKTKQR